MVTELEQIITKIKSEGKDYSDFRVLLNAIKESGRAIEKDELSEFLNNDYRIQLHTTPNSVAKIIGDLSNSLNAKNALDICCGTGNILYFLQNSFDDLTGIEINEEVAALTSYFIPDLKIIKADTFEYPFTKTYDLVVGNLPWGPPVIYNGEKLRLEEAFLRKAIDLCNQNGDVIVVVPYNLLMNSAFYRLRQEFSSSLKTVIGFPSGLIRHSGIKTALLHFKKNGSEIVKIGIAENLQDLEKSLNNLISTEVKNSDIKDRWDPEFFIKNQKTDKELSEFETKDLSELAEVISGRLINRELLSDKGDFLYLKPSNINNAALQETDSSKYVTITNLNTRDKSAIAQPNDIIVSTIFNKLKLYVVTKEDPPLFISNNMAIIRSSYDDYILSYLKSGEGQRLFSEQAQGLRKGVVIPHVTLKDLRHIKIPILPLSGLNSLGDNAIKNASKSELESLKMLLENYRQENLRLKSENKELQSKDFFANDRLTKIEEQLELLHKKVDTLLDLVKDLSNDFSKIKKLSRTDEDKLFQFYQSIDQKLEKVLSNQSNTIESYIEITKRWLDLWELLDKESKKFLPIAELIFDELSQIYEADFSPFIVQYCRALENEILKKLFEAYHSEGLLKVNVNELVADDLLNEKTGKFASMVKRNRLTYTMGDMNFIMSLLKSDGNTLKSSKLLQHFRSFSLSYFEQNIFEKSFLSDLNNITSNYRNKAAHPNILDLTIAKECQLLLRKNLNLFLEAKK